jgi:hypothetical protein
MRQTRLSGSEGGVRFNPSSRPNPGAVMLQLRDALFARFPQRLPALNVGWRFISPGGVNLRWNSGIFFLRAGRLLIRWLPPLTGQTSR